MRAQYLEIWTNESGPVWQQGTGAFFISMSGYNYWGDRQAGGCGSLTTGKHDDDEDQPASR